MRSPAFKQAEECNFFTSFSQNLGFVDLPNPVYSFYMSLEPQLELDILQINPLFDQELDQWLFVGELRRSIYISPVGDYDFDGIDTTEFTVAYLPICRDFPGTFPKL